MKRAVLNVILSTLFIVSYSQSWNSAIGIEAKCVRSIIVYNADTLLAGVDNEGIYISYNQGENWTQFALQGENVWSLLKRGNVVIAGTEGNDFYRTTNIKENWEKIPISDLIVFSLKLHEDTIFACTAGSAGPGAIFTSSDTGKTWNQWGSTPPYAYLDIDFDSNGRTYVASPSGAYYSDSQSDWIQTTGGNGETFRTVYYIGNDSIIYGNDYNIFISADNGVSMSLIENLEPGRIIHLDNTYYLLTSEDIKYTYNLGSAWESLNIQKYVLSLIKVDNKILAGTTEQGIYIYNPDASPGIISDKEIDYNNVYPNPAGDLLNINIKDSSRFTFYLYNSLGQIVKITDITPIDIKDCIVGIYYFKFIRDQKTYSGKILIE
jgi:photosystem II stability/assembly factor-like uncharacterized protein